MRREVQPTGPASSCPRCYAPGELCPEQYISNHGGKQRTRTLRFQCHHCIFEWSANRLESEMHGRFMARINTERNPL